MAKIIPLRRTAEIGCSACGATVDAACDCGAPYLPAGQRVAEFDAVNPGKSERVAAAALGIAKTTVHDARQQGGRERPPERVTGADGKSYPATRAPRDEEPEFSPKELSDRNRGSFLLRAQEAKNFAFYAGKVDAKLVEFARGTASAWCDLVETLEKQL